MSDQSDWTVLATYDALYEAELAAGLLEGAGILTRIDQRGGVGIFGPGHEGRSVRGVALFLATVGVYGMVALAVNSRMHEIGVRRAVGASSREVIGRLLAFGLSPVVPGVVFGLGGALATTRMLEGLLYEVSPTDPGTLVAASLLLVLVAAAACILAARRALGIDPVAVLRAE